MFLYVTNQHVYKVDIKNCYALERDWQENSVTWNTPWQNPGGAFSEPPVFINTNTKKNVWEDYDVTSAIKDIVENSGENYGFLFRFDNHTPAYGVMLASSEYTDESKRPKLTVKYDINTEIKNQDLENGNQIMVTRTPVSVMVYMPFAGSCSISDLHGRQIGSFHATHSNQWYQLSEPLSSGMHIISIMHKGEKVVGKCCFMQ